MHIHTVIAIINLRVLTDRYFRRQYGRVVVIVLFIVQRTPELALWNDNAFIDDHALKIGQCLFDQKYNVFQKSDVVQSYSRSNG